jgi:hypothetical protein
MEIRLRTTGAVITDSEFRAIHQQTSFPPILTAELLASFDADPVLNGSAPQATHYQVIARDGVEELNGQWFTKFSLVDMSDEAKAAVDTQQAASVRAERNRRLAESDWTQGKDIPDSISTPWAAYRQELRDLTAQGGFPWDIIWPTQPE